MVQFLSKRSETSAKMRPDGRRRRVGDLGDLRRCVSPVVPQDHRDALVLRQVAEHVPEFTRIAGQACGWFWWVQGDHPAPSKCRSASADDGTAQVGAGLADLVQSPRDLDETVLDEIFGFGVAAHEGVRETHHAGVFGRKETLEYSSVFCNRFGRGAHFPHH